MTKWLVWYTLEGGYGDRVEVEAETKDDAADKAMDLYPTIDTVDNIEELG